MTEETQATEEQAAPEGSTLGVADLSNAAQVIDIAVQRGAFRANEASQVGEVYNKLANFVAQVKAQQESAEENTEAEQTTAAAE